MSVRKSPCPICHKLVTNAGAARKSHMAKHQGQHWNTGNHYAAQFKAGVRLERARQYVRTKD